MVFEKCVESDYAEDQEREVRDYVVEIRNAKYGTGIGEPMVQWVLCNWRKKEDNNGCAQCECEKDGASYGHDGVFIKIIRKIMEESLTVGINEIFMTVVGGVLTIDQDC